MSEVTVKRVAVIGGGPGGSFAAAQLAADFSVTLLDEKLAWEKPCGGGVTHKAVRRYPVLGENARPKKTVSEALLSSPRRGAARLALASPILVYSRLDLNGLLLDRAAAAGCELVRDRVTALERSASGWRLQGRSRFYEADYVVLASGARTAFRHLTGPLRASDVGVAMGYFVPGSQPHLEVQFLGNFEGYVWVFPRTDHLSVGICGKPAREPAASIRHRLLRFMDERGISRSGAEFYSHALPLLSAGAFRERRVQGEGWAAVGDAAGMVDPVTGEGIYYALRSAELLAECMLSGRLADYAQRLREDCIRELEFAARLNHRFYFGEFLGADVPTRLVQFARRSATFRAVVADLFSGAQGYQDLKRRLKSIIEPTLRELAWNVVVSAIMAARL
jgi:flavin-dependent dehydrogenase